MKFLVLEFKKWINSLFSEATTQVVPHPEFGHNKDNDVFVIFDAENIGPDLINLGFIKDENPSTGKDVFIMLRKPNIRANFFKFPNDKWGVRIQGGPAVSGQTVQVNKADGTKRFVTIDKIVRTDRFGMDATIDQFTKPVGRYGAYPSFEELIKDSAWVNALSQLGVDTTPIDPVKGKPAIDSPVAAGKPATGLFTGPSKREKLSAQPGEPSDFCKMVLSSPDQQKVDDAFYKIITTGKQGHIVIGARAGSGKTTLLNCLWQKYGRPTKQKWLYLVFNKKNEEEAKKKFGDDIEVRTTNSFLGKVLKSSDVTGMHQTKIYVGQKTKVRLAMSTPQWDSFLRDMNIPTIQKIESELSEYKKNIFYDKVRSFCINFVDLIVDASEKLCDISKQYAASHLDKAALDEKINEVFSKYDLVEALDSLDKELASMTSRLSDKEKAAFYAISGKINELFPFDRDEAIKELAKWLLVHTAPGFTGFDKHLGNLPIKNLVRTRNQNTGKWELKTEVGYIPYSKARDFSDDFWYTGLDPSKIAWDFHQYDVVLADEVQDFNHVQKIMLQELAKRGASIVAVGDPYQSAYRFRGADNDSFENIQKMLVDLHKEQNPENSEEDIVFKMPKNRRSRKNIIDFVNSATRVNDLEVGKDYSKDNPDYHGEVTDGYHHVVDIADLIKEKMVDGKLDKSTALIARTNPPLAWAAIELLKNGIPFMFVGKDFSREIEHFINDLTKSLRVDEKQLLEPLLGEHENFTGGGLIAKWVADQFKQKKGHSENKILQDIVSKATNFESIAVAAISVNDNIKTVADLKKWISDFVKNHAASEDDEKLKDNNKSVILTTAHKSKGFEYQRVYILDNNMFPHPRARMQADLDQEENLKYIAYTRAEDELHILDQGRLTTTKEYRRELRAKERQKKEEEANKTNSEEQPNKTNSEEELKRFDYLSFPKRQLEADLGESYKYFSKKFMKYR